MSFRNHVPSARVKEPLSPSMVKHAQSPSWQSMMPSHNILFLFLFFLFLFFFFFFFSKKWWLGISMSNWQPPTVNCAGRDILSVSLPARDPCPDSLPLSQYTPVDSTKNGIEGGFTNNQHSNDSAVMIG